MPPAVLRRRPPPHQAPNATASTTIVPGSRGGLASPCLPAATTEYGPARSRSKEEDWGGIETSGHHCRRQHRRTGLKPPPQPPRQAAAAANRITTSPSAAGDRATRQGHGVGSRAVKRPRLCLGAALSGGEGKGRYEARPAVSIEGSPVSPRGGTRGSGKRVLQQ